MLLCCAGTKTYAYDIAVKNADGKTIYYNYINNGTELEVTYGNVSHNTYYGDIAIPESVIFMNKNRKVTNISNFAFIGCYNLTSITIGNGVKTIGECAFADCKSMASITIPNSVTSIGWAAFHNCSSLTSVIIPNSVTFIGGGAFYGCSGLISIEIPSSVKTISGGIFANCSKLSSLTIPNSVTCINDEAFRGCKELVSLVIPDSVTSIGNRVFYNCSGLTSVIIGNRVDSIGDYAFAGCSNLTHVSIPNSVISIGKSAFSNYNGSISSICVTLGEESYIGVGGTTIISEGYDLWFVGDEYAAPAGLTSVTIPDDVTYIGSEAFANCKDLISVTIGSGVKEIGEGAFNCDNLATVISKIETPFAINGKSSSGAVFSTNTFMNADLFVPVGTIDKYKATTGWKDFIWITEGIPSGIGEVKTEVDKTEVSRYTLDGKKLSEPQEGINIIKMSDGTTKKVIVK